MTTMADLESAREMNRGQFLWFAELAQNRTSTDPGREYWLRAIDRCLDGELSVRDQINACRQLEPVR